jgi:hypothetical protein
LKGNLNANTLSGRRVSLHLSSPRTLPRRYPSRVGCILNTLLGMSWMWMSTSLIAWSVLNKTHITDNIRRYPSSAWRACIAPRGKSCASMNGAKVRRRLVAVLFFVGTDSAGFTSSTPVSDVCTSTVVEDTEASFLASSWEVTCRALTQFK